MSGIPITRRIAPTEKQAAIRSAVTNSSGFRGFAGASVPARAEHAPAFYRLIADPQVHEPIYTLPKPVTPESAAAFIDRHNTERERGEGLLLISFDEAGEASGYQDVQVWPQWAAAELGGAIRPDLQGKGAGGAGAAAAFAWLFDDIGVDLICETAALDNIRTHRLLERIGFERRGEIESALPGGGVRASLAFELSRDQWMKARPADERKFLSPAACGAA